MDPRNNPYAPGAGTRPPELAGRGELVENAAIALDRIKNQRAARSIILYGLRGVGKTVLLNEFRRNAEAKELSCIQVEVPEGKSLPALLAPALRTVLLKMSQGEKGKIRKGLERARKALAGFVAAMRVKYEDIEMRLDFTGEKGVADSGDLETDLAELLKSVGMAAQERESVVAIFIDELQYVPEEQLAALIMALHRANQDQLPVTMLGAGLPQLVGLTGKAKSYAERLFEFVPIGALDDTAATAALCIPAEKEGVEYEKGAIKSILKATEGYPYFLQEWGKHSWHVAESSPIKKKDAEHGTELALAELDRSFFRVRFDRLTPAEKRYLRAMAELGPGPHRSGDIAEELERNVTNVAPTRSILISKGMIYSPSHGDTAFTVPLFDGFMKRIVPEW